MGRFKSFIINDLEGVDPIWHVQLAVLIALLLQLLLPARLVYGPHILTYLVPLLEIFLLIGLSISTPQKNVFESKIRNFFSVSLIILITIFNTSSLTLLVQHLLEGKSAANGLELIVSAVAIYLTNIIIFGLWYWEIDRGGPGNRELAHEGEIDFLFPQMSEPQFAPTKWKPNFMDYLYVSFTNATAFSPTDTMPLTTIAKFLMLIQSAVSLITIALVAARAVNILN